jgi:general secretion pathway protein K
MAQTLYDYRQEIVPGKDIHDFSSINWYKKIPGLDDINIDSNLITVSSDVFRIESEAAMGNIKTSVSAIVQRVQRPQSGKWTCKVLSWQM